jgi:hypothetical protein
MVALERELEAGLARLAEHAHRSVPNTSAALCGVVVGGRQHLGGSGPVAMDLLALDTTAGRSGVDDAGAEGSSSSCDDGGDIWSTVGKRARILGVGVVSVPLLSRDRRVGTLALFAPSTATTPDVDDLVLVELAVTLGLAVDSLRVVAVAKLTSILVRAGSKNACQLGKPLPAVLV